MHKKEDLSFQKPHLGLLWGLVTAVVINADELLVAPQRGPEEMKAIRHDDGTVE